MSNAKSQRLRVADVREVFRIVGECREYGTDVGAWRGHLASRIVTLVAGQVCLVGEAATPARREALGDVLHAVDHGWPSPRAREIYLDHMASGGYKTATFYKKMQRLAAGLGTCSRDQVASDREWRAWSLYSELLRPCEVDEYLFSLHDMPGGRHLSMIGIHRIRGGCVFQQRDRRLIQLLHEEIGRHIGSALVTLDDPSPSDLTPRLRQTLRCLLEGDGEKQVARRLGLSTMTIHDYVKAIYRHFHVGSRPELLAFFLRRSGLRLPELDVRGESPPWGG